MNIKKLSDWNIGVQNSLMIAGPCSAETESQVLTIANQLKDNGMNIFRAGIWKPRTRPNSFEGVGSPGLAWLQKVKESTGMLITVEVANAKHVKEALEADVDILWIGARTTVNPFVVQEIADALRDVDIPVLVKNPINPDLELWIGAMERINQAGITRIGAIHRGFSQYEYSKYRNTPKWQIPIDLKIRYPNLPIICDPSHIAGTRDLIAPISQKALDLNMDGLMIETHHNPEEAWSDAKQQVTPETLKHILDNLVMRDVHPSNILLSELEDLRHQIDIYDQELMDVLEKRMQCSVGIGEYKKKNDMTILQPDRWESLLDRIANKGTQLGLSQEMVKSIFSAIHLESINKQEEILSKLKVE